MGSLFTTFSPELDGQPVPVPIGGTDPLTIEIPAGAYPTPLWIRFGGNNIEMPSAARSMRVDSLPFRTVRLCGEVEIFSFDPSGPECVTP